MKNLPTWRKRQWRLKLEIRRDEEVDTDEYCGFRIAVEFVGFLRN